MLVIDITNPVVLVIFAFCSISVVESIPASSVGAIAARCESVTTDAMRVVASEGTKVVASEGT